MIIAHRLQVQALESTSQGKALLDDNRQRLQALITQVEQEETATQQKNTLLPGTVLSRFYQGKEHKVTVTHDGQFSWEGRLYQSLSPIAREITGTRWSGPKFFGVFTAAKKKTSKPNKKRQGGAR